MDQRAGVVFGLNVRNSTELELLGNGPGIFKWGFWKFNFKCNRGGAETDAEESNSFKSIGTKKL
jgi:hypothetical protein